MMKMIFRGPVLTASGYGVHSRQLLRSVIESGDYEISVEPTKWGETPFLIGDSDPFIKEILALCTRREQERQGNVEYDISVQVTIPNEFQKLAKINIGVTAGIEVDRVSPEWIIKANEMVDLLIVPSVHSAETFGGIQYQDDKGGMLKLSRPMALVPEGVDTRFFNTDPVEDLVGLDQVDTEFNFLSVGLGLDKPIGEDRKNIANLVKWFLERFKDDRKVGLILKVGLVGTSLMDHELIVKRLREIKQLVGAGEFPRIHLVHGRLTDAQLASLYKSPKVKAYITTTHGEGFGLPIIEAAACGVPVLATNWSGHLDFLKIDGKKRFIALEHDLTQIPKSAVWKGVMDEGTNWATVREDDVKSKMKKVVLSYDVPKQWATELAVHVGATYSLEKVGHYFADTLRKFMAAGAGSNSKQPRSQEEATNMVRSQLGIDGSTKTLLYTMPMSAGDVYISTAVVDSLKKRHPDHRIYFATDDKYQSILDGNADIDVVMGFEPWMQDVPFLETIFDEVYTPNLAIQTTSANWIRGGKGRLLADEMAAQCQTELGEYKIGLVDPGVSLPEEFIVLHPGSGVGQWEARNYHHWQDVVINLVKLSGLPVVQVGMQDDPSYQGATDLRGRTPDYRNLAFVISKAKCVVGIDSVSMHLAAGLGTPHVALFGSSYSTSTGPAKSKALSVLIDTPSRYTCDKACYKYQCSVKRDTPCVNEITPKQVVHSVLNIVTDGLDDEMVSNLVQGYEEFRPKISGYIHVLDAQTHGYPYLESIQSMLGFCDEVVVVDGGSTDETVSRINSLADDRVKLYVQAWDWNEPGMDGMQKAYGRAMCTGDFLWQQDADEVVHEQDYAKVRDLVKRFPKGTDLVHLPVVELWGDRETVRTDRHSWKWRLSRNNFRITHGINVKARVMDEKTGRTYAKKGQSDGCEFIDIMTGEYIPHAGFYTKELETLRLTSPERYGEEMNKVFDSLPRVYHYSWASVPRKISNFKAFWNKCWSNLYNDPSPEDRFPEVTDDESLQRVAAEVKARGGEHRPARTFKLAQKNPALMEGWLSRVGC